MPTSEAVQNAIFISAWNLKYALLIIIRILVVCSGICGHKYG